MQIERALAAGRDSDVSGPYTVIDYCSVQLAAVYFILMRRIVRAMMLATTAANMSTSTMEPEPDNMSRSVKIRRKSKNEGAGQQDQSETFEHFPLLGKRNRAPGLTKTVTLADVRGHSPQCCSCRNITLYISLK